MANPANRRSTQNENTNVNNSNSAAEEDKQYEDLSTRTSNLTISLPPTSTPNPTSDPRFQISPITSTRPTEAQLEARMDSAWYFDADYATYVRSGLAHHLNSRLHRASALSAQAFNLPNPIPVPPLILMGHDSSSGTRHASEPALKPPPTPVIRPMSFGAHSSIQAGSSSSAQADSFAQQAPSDMEHWVCGNEKCEWKNEMSAARCVGCGWEVLDSMCLVKMGDGTWGWGIRR